MAYPLGVFTWLAAESVRRRSAAGLLTLGKAALAIGALTALCYAPIIAHSGPASLIHNEYVVPSTWLDFVAEMPVRVAATLEYWRSGVPDLLALVIAACTVIALAAHSAITRHRVGLPHSAAVWCIAILLTTNRMPPDRVWQWMIPIAAGLAGAGLFHALRQRHRM